MFSCVNPVTLANASRLGKGVEPMLCCMYPYMPVTLANGSCYAG